MSEQKITSWRRIRVQLWTGLTVLFFFQCTSSTTQKTKEAEYSNFGEPEEPTEITASELPSSPSVSYHLISTRDSSKWLQSLQPGDTLTTLLVLNRLDRTNLLTPDTLVVPDSIGYGIDLYSPFPDSLEELRTVHKIVLISYYAQAFAVYNNGSRIRWGPVSLGKESTPTPTGLFATNWKAKKTISTVNPTWVMEWYFNIENLQGISWHQYELPGYPASHGCVRLNKEDAYWLYNWADQWKLDESRVSVYGTPVILFGSYPYGQRKPWLMLPENNRALEISPSELRQVVQEFLPVVLDRQAMRDSIKSAF